MLAVVVGVLAVAGCAQPEPGPGLPTFPSAVATPGAVAPSGPDQGAIPDDCSRLIAVGDLGALLALPLDSVAVRGTVGVPAPSVERTERTDCAYTGTTGPVRGRALLSINAAAYATPAAAAAQWQRNADAEDGSRRELPIGAARSILVERRGEALLTVLYGSGTLTLTLPDRPLPRDRTEVLVDLAQRVLPGIEATSPVPITRTPAPARAAGAS
jgi:hypothetical protein